MFPKMRASSASSRTAPCLIVPCVRSRTAGSARRKKALARGVPVCAVPFGRDQMEVAWRVASAFEATGGASAAADAVESRLLSSLELPVN